MENELKKGFLRILAKQGPAEGWRVKWIDPLTGEPRSFFSQSVFFVTGFAERKMKQRVAVTIEPYTKTYKLEPDGE